MSRWRETGIVATGATAPTAILRPRRSAVPHLWLHIDPLHQALRLRVVPQHDGVGALPPTPAPAPLVARRSTHASHYLNCTTASRITGDLAARASFGSTPMRSPVPGPSTDRPSQKQRSSSGPVGGGSVGRGRPSLGLWSSTTSATGGPSRAAGPSPGAPGRPGPVSAWGSRPGTRRCLRSPRARTRRSAGSAGSRPAS